MHCLDRTSVPIPTCLGRYDYRVDSWDRDTPNSDERAEILSSLERMQGRRCAYCECNLDENGQHIEHFRQRSRYPAGTFDWDNLFWSCSRQDSCGSHKDACRDYGHADLIKPDIEDPEHFFVFTTNGSVSLRSGLTPNEQHRAQETLRVFNLDAQWGPLRMMRRIAIVGYLQALDELRELLSSCTPQEIGDYIDSEFAYTRNLPFCTAIKHVLTL